MTEDEASALVPLAVELIGTVRDYGPDDVAAVLARIPDGRLEAMAVILAAMVDPDRTAAELLAWTDWTPPAPVLTGQPGRPALPREHGTERGYQQHRTRYEMPACEPCAIAHRSHERRAARVRRAVA